MTTEQVSAGMESDTNKGKNASIAHTGIEMNEESDYTSSSGSSSEDEAEDDDDDDEVEPQTGNGQLSRGQRSTVTMRTVPRRVEPAVGLRSRLDAFLPQIERSNRELESNGDAHALRVDEVGENEVQYIEMNLGLGVLTEQRSEDGNLRYRDDSGDESSSLDERNDEGEQQEEKGQPVSESPKSKLASAKNSKIQEL